MTEIALGVAGWVLAALSAGLWWGERGRRLDAQARETYGVTQRARLDDADRVRPMPPGPEERAARAGGPQDEMPPMMAKAIERGAEHLMAEARKRGTTLSKPEAVSMAAEMLYSAGPMGAG